MTQYARGSDFERTVAAALTADGYLVVRAAGSHGNADLVALKPGQILLVQCKLAGPPAVGPADWNGLWDDAVNVGAIPLIAWRPKRGVIGYQEMYGPKSGVRGVRPPCRTWTPDEVAVTP